MMEREPLAGAVVAKVSSQVSTSEPERVTETGVSSEVERETGAAVPVVPIPDTVKQVAGSRVVRTLERASLAAAQTPQAFRVSVLLEAHEKAAREGYTATDCASLVERLGVEVRTLPGRPGNWKVTWPADLERAESLLSASGGRLS